MLASMEVIVLKISPSRTMWADLVRPDRHRSAGEMPPDPHLLFGNGNDTAGWGLSARIRRHRLTAGRLPAVASVARVGSVRGWLRVPRVPAPVAGRSGAETGLLV